MKYLIAGASGQLAQSFIEYFQKNNIDFFAPQEQDFDITNEEKILNIINKYNPTILINCAAYNNVEQAQVDDTVANLINNKAVSCLAKICEQKNIKFVHFSTDYVFDGTKGSLYTEQDIPNPLNNYGKTKLLGEQEALKYKNSLVLRLSWVIGYGKQNFLYKLSSWIEKKSKLNISADEISVPCFTFDIVTYTMLALDKKLTGLYNLTNSSKASRYELAKEYVTTMNYKVELTPVPMASFPSKVKRPLQTAMSNEKISKELNVVIPTWQVSLQKYCKNLK